MVRNNRPDRHTAAIIADCGKSAVEQLPDGSENVLRRFGQKTFRTRCNANHVDLKGLLCVFIASAVVASCSSSIPESRSSTPPLKNTVTPLLKLTVPEGWADITSRSKQQQIMLWLVNRELSGTMVLRELQADSATKRSLFKEDMNLVAMISLRMKIPENDPEYRVTRVPALIDPKREFSSYAYSEKGLLRRVVVFKKRNKFMELELMQERSSAEFDVLTDDLLELAATLYEE